MHFNISGDDDDYTDFIRATIANVGHTCTLL